jgi:hypothetical protein
MGAVMTTRQTAVAVDEDAQYLTFMLGGEMFAIGILGIKEIIEYGSLTVVPLVGKHLAAAEQLDLVIECLGAIRLGVAQQQFQGFVGIPAVQALMIAQAPWQHEVAHAANQPLWVPKGDRHAGTEQGPQARRPRRKTHLARGQYHFGRTDRLFHGLR